VQAVQAVLEVSGELKLNPDGTEVRRLPLKVQGRVAYDERLLEADHSESAWSSRSVRYYTQAEAEIEIGSGSLTPKLAPDRRLVVAQVGKDGSSLTWPLGLMNSDDLDLIDIPGNTLLLSSLLPQTPVRLDDTWEPATGPLALLVGLDVITHSDVVGTLDKIDGDTAVLDFQGTIQGAIGGVASEIVFRAKSNYDLSQHQITWFAASLKEDRAIGHAEPGLDVTARLRVAVNRIAASDHLSDATLQGLSLEAETVSRPLVFESRNSNFRLTHDHRWRSMIDRHDLCVFRFVDRGDLVAQCNISELPDFEAGKHMALEAFQEEVQQALGDKFGQVVDGAKWVSDNGTHVLRIQVSGMVSEIPVNWIHYHLSSPEGRRAAIAFTLETDLLERFAENDRLMVDTFEFLPRPEPTEAQLRTPQDPRRS
jgi:hypothetical protein